MHTLAYLVKGGRLSRFKGTIAETLDMKPILIVDKEGSLQVLKTVRGRKKSMKALIDYAKSNGYDLPAQTLAFCHGEDVIGAVVLVESDEKSKMGEVEQKLALSAAGFLGRQMEQ